MHVMHAHSPDFRDRTIDSITCNISRLTGVCSSVVDRMTDLLAAELPQASQLPILGWGCQDCFWGGSGVAAYRWGVRGWGPPSAVSP